MIDNLRGSVKLERESSWRESTECKGEYETKQSNRSVATERTVPNQIIPDKLDFCCKRKKLCRFNFSMLLHLEGVGGKGVEVCVLSLSFSLLQVLLTKLHRLHLQQRVKIRRCLFMVCFMPRVMLKPFTTC